MSFVANVLRLRKYACWSIPACGSALGYKYARDNNYDAMSTTGTVIGCGIASPITLGAAIVCGTLCFVPISIIAFHNVITGRKNNE
jgi:hypothetical protein